MFCQGRRPRPTSPTVYLTQRSRRTTRHFSTDPTPAQGNNMSNSHGLAQQYGKKSAKLRGNQSRRPALTCAIAARCPAQTPRHMTTTATTSSSPAQVQPLSHPTTATTTSSSPSQVQPPRRPSTAALTSSSPTQVHALQYITDLTKKPCQSAYGSSNALVTSNMNTNKDTPRKRPR